MIKSELVLRIAEQNPHLFQQDAEAVVNAVLDRIGKALAAGDRVEIRGFGAFSTKRRDGRMARNPRTGEAVEIGDKIFVNFKPGLGMQKRLNGGAKARTREPESLRKAS